MTITPIHLPDDWSENDLIFFEEFCELFRLPQGTVRTWRRQPGRGPRWFRFNGTGRLYTTVAEIRRWLRASTAHAPASQPVRTIKTH